jgi:hypothetical protein
MSGRNERESVYDVWACTSPEIARRILEGKGIGPERYEDILKLKGRDARCYHNEKALVVIAMGDVPRLFDVVCREVRRGEHDLPGEPVGDVTKMSRPDIGWVRAILEANRGRKKEGD